MKAPSLQGSDKGAGSENRGDQAPSTSQRGGDDAADSDLPVLDSVLNYEKINRIGEGTYGVVCESPSTAAAGASVMTTADRHESCLFAPSVPKNPAPCLFPPRS